MNIEDRLLTINPYSRSGEKQNKIEKIVVHWVGNANTSALANRNYFENLRKTHTTSASSHYIIGLNGEIIRCIPDNEVAFHAGNRAMNRKSIGIEDCHPDWNGKFNDNTYNSLLELCVELCKKYGLSANDVIRHYDVTGKDCPRYYVQNPNEWNSFKNKVAEKLNGQTVSQTTTTTNQGYLVTINTDVLNIRQNAGTVYPVVGTVKKGEVYTIVEEQGNWGKLKSGVGWIYLQYTVKGKQNVANSQTNQNQGYITKTVIAKGGLRVRKSPNLFSGVVKVFPYGTKVKVYYTTNGWAKGTYGYMYAKYLK